MLYSTLLLAALALTPASASAEKQVPTNLARLRQRALCSSGLTSYFCDLTSDVKNCGSVGHKCPVAWENGVGAACVDSQCQPEECNPGFAFDAEHGGCVDILSDVVNCGAIGSSCSETLVNSVSQACQQGVCVPTVCKAGFSIDGSKCTTRYASDVENCGAAGVACSASSWSNGSGAKCSSGKCQPESCDKGYFYDAVANECRELSAIDTTSDFNHCGAIGNKCQNVYVNGGFGECVNSVCQTVCKAGFSWDAKLLYCRPTTRDLNNCGAIDQVCKPHGSSASICVAGECFASQCKLGYALRNGVCHKIDITSDVHHCGALNHPCVFFPKGANGICVASQCQITTCPEKYSFKEGTCIKDPVRQRARVKKEKNKKPTLCPAKEETACPIAGSASFEAAASHHFTKPRNDYSGIMIGAGGYECVDTQVSIDSCGGCSSTGEGQDCTLIPHAAGVGCDVGVCKVFSCSSGFRPNLDGTMCVRARTDTRSVKRNHSRRATGAAHAHNAQHHMNRMGASFRHHGDIKA
ncbi:hypothetical protein BCR35DRAFT_278613 [Leucosporidium creatinivorum]|uniref:Protein CPL1-like domain-containing protein n=1 Tax=Leucosporidium creatinivorum TaxID=106004 RepID=A0A1Y2FFC3_9BASI|nr:hypothetical protein BCR35DRAFT_278613 [Leucosporidium creatinivorum]